MRLMIHPIQILREHDETDYEYILFSDETGLSKPIAILTPIDLQMFVANANAAQSLVKSTRQKRETEPTQ